jgi:hypothetical protein
LGKLLFDLFQKRSSTEYLSHGCGMNPNGCLKGKGVEKSHSLDKLPSEASLEETPQEKIGRRNDKEASEESVIEKIGH